MGLSPRISIIYSKEMSFPMEKKVIKLDKEFVFLLYIMFKQIVWISLNVFLLVRVIFTVIKFKWFG